MLAAAGLSRLGCAAGEAPGGARAVFLDEAACLPAVGQGALAIEIRSDDAAAAQAVAPLHDAAAGAEVDAERAFLDALGGGCRAPIAARARAAAGRLQLSGLVARPDGSRILRLAAEGDLGEAAPLGRRLAHAAMAQGAGEILASVDR